MLQFIFKSKNAACFDIDWCNLCNIAIITCPKCKATSCNSSVTCDYCFDAINEFLLKKRRVEDYLGKREKKIYRKAYLIKKKILSTLSEGDDFIDWKKLNKNGKLNNEEIEFFL